MKKILIVIENTGRGFSAYSPDLEGCTATGATREEVEQAMVEAVRFHVEGLKKEGYVIPEPKSYSKFIEIKE